MILDKIENPDSNYNTIASTHLVGTRETAKQINKIICENLPNSEFGIRMIIATATDTLNHKKVEEIT
ncbi:17996_t:CDS:1, partial [Gigaspora rosea]